MVGEVSGVLILLPSMLNTRPACLSLHPVIESAILKINLQVVVIKACQAHSLILLPVLHFMPINGTGFIPVFIFELFFDEHTKWR